MGVGAFQKIGSTTVEITEQKHNALIRESEQLRILKNFINQESTITKYEVLNLINAMEQSKEN